MGRRSGVEGFLRATVRAAKASERAHQRAIRAQETHIRQVARQTRMALAQQQRDFKAAQREEKAQYLAERQGEVDDLNRELDQCLEDIRDVLTHTLAVNDKIDFESLHRKDSFSSFQTPADLRPGSPPSPPSETILSWWQKLFPGAEKRRIEAQQRAINDYQNALAKFEDDEASKRNRLAQLRAEYERNRQEHVAEIEEHNAEVEDFRQSYFEKEPTAVVTYNEMVLERSEYPEEGFPKQFRVAYVPESAELVIEYDLPEPSIIPEQASYRYVKTKDTIEAKSRKASEIKELYRDLIAAITLRTLHEIFEADQADAITVAVFNGIVDTLDPSSGKDIRVPLISVRVVKSDFLELRLDRVEKIACLRNLGANVSNRPDELQAVKPIVEFDMVDKRFIDQSDLLSNLESRPNLMELTPTDFEVLVSNLFGKMGLDTKLTRSSRDGGVDAVAFDTRPVIGGKVVIQAKRYRDTVGVSAVRDLYGTMMNEGANKGILVCTSGYGPDAYNFSKDKPIELIDGGGLLYLLREHGGISARIAI
jgi:restriction system protein